MKKKFISFMFAAMGFMALQAQVVGDIIEYNGKEYTVQCENMITNPSFDNGISDWLSGSGKAITTTGFTVYDSNGWDGGAYIVGTQNTGKGGDHSICMDWPIENDKTYYFRYYIKRVSETAEGTEGYVCSSQSTKFCGDELSSVNGKCDANCVWTKNEMLVVNSSNTYIQFSARWISGRLGFDGFFLAEVAEKADNTTLLALIDECEDYYAHFGEDASAEYETFLASIESARTASEATEAAELNAAFTALSEALLDYRIANASDADPVDVTKRYVTNAYFDDGSANWDKVNENVNNGINVRFLTHFDKAGSREVEINGTPSTATSITQTINNLPKGSFVFQVSAVAIDGTGAKSDSIGVYIMCNGAEAPLSTANDSTPEHFTIEGVVLDQSIVIGMRANASCACTYVAIDSVRLIYHGLNATYLEEYMQEMRDRLTAWEDENYDKTLPGVIADLEDCISWSYDQTIETLSDFTAVYDSLVTVFTMAQNSLGLVTKLQKALAEAEELLNSTDYPGHEAYTTVYENTVSFLESEDETKTHYSDIEAQIAALAAAKIAYYDSQIATREEPANKTHLIGYPYFSDNTTWDASVGNSYTIPAPWVINNVVSASDVWVGKCRPASLEDGESDPVIYRSGLNNWSNNFSSLEVYQDLTGLANGIYAISAEIITQEDYDGAFDQHVYGKSALGTFSSQNLEEVSDGGWNSYTWTTLKTGFVVVTDGCLRIGLASTHDSGSANGQAGWWQATNFQLFYYGDYTDADLSGAWESKLANAEELIALLLPSDATLFGNIVDAAKALAAEGSYIAACAKIDEGLEAAQTAAADLAAFYAGSYANVANAIAELYNDKPKALLDKAITFADNQLAMTSAKSTWLPEIAAKLDAYITYAQYAEEVEFLLASSTGYVQEYKDVVALVLARNYTDLEAWFTTPETVTYLQGKLQQAVAAMSKSVAYNAVAGEDVSALIITNPNAEAAAGWTYIKRNGTNGPISSSQHYLYSGTDNTEAAYTNPYLDAWTPTAATLQVSIYQILNDVPNGTYTLESVARTDGDNAYLFAASAVTLTDDTVAVDAAAKFLTIPNYGAIRGGLWLKDSADLADGILIEPTEIYNCNSGTGWGWSRISIDNIVVTNHQLVIGVTTDSILSYPVFNEYKAFTGTWYSADEFKLTLVELGDNTGWSIETKVDGIETTPQIKVENGVISGKGIAVYSLDGRRMNSNSVLERGVYIVRQAGKSQKVFVK